MTEFQTWITAQIEQYAHGSHQTFAALLGVRRSTVSAWVNGTNSVSLVSARKLAKLTGVSLLEIGRLDPPAKFTHGVGNHLRDQSGEVTLPAAVPTVSPLDVTVWKPVAFKKCTGCNHKRAQNEQDADRREVCRVLDTVGMMLCAPVDMGALLRLVNKLAGED